MADTRSERSTDARATQSQIQREHRKKERCFVLNKICGQTSHGWWGWVIIAAAFFSNVTTGGLHLASGVLYRHIMHTFNTTTTQQTASWALSMSWGVGWVCSPFITALCIKYSMRPVCVIGGFVSALGTLFHSFAEKSVHIFLSHSIITSFGLAMCSMSSDMIIEAFFQENFTLAHTVCRVGRFLGMALFAISIDTSIENMGWLRGLQASTTFVCINFVFGLFYVPVGNYNKVIRKQQREHTDEIFTPWKNCFDFHMLKDKLFLWWMLIQFLIHLGLYTPLLLLIVHCDQPGFHSSMGANMIMTIGLTAIVGYLVAVKLQGHFSITYLFLAQENVLTAAILVPWMVLAMTTIPVALISAGYGFVFGRITASCQMPLMYNRNQTSRLHARSWVLLARGLGVICGPASSVALNTAYRAIPLGFYMPSTAFLLGWILMVVLWRRFHPNLDRRLPEIDINPPLLHEPCAFEVDLADIYRTPSEAGRSDTTCSTQYYALSDYIRSAYYNKQDTAYITPDLLTCNGEISPRVPIEDMQENYMFPSNEMDRRALIRMQRYNNYLNKNTDISTRLGPIAEVPSPEGATALRHNNGDYVNPENPNGGRTKQKHDRDQFETSGYVQSDRPSMWAISNAFRQIEKGEMSNYVPPSEFCVASGGDFPKFTECMNLKSSSNNGWDLYSSDVYPLSQQSNLPDDKKSLDIETSV